MKVDTQRKIDRFLGIPICFILTWVLKPFLKKPKAPKRILFLELSEMGSTILADPAMRKAANTFNAELFFVIFKKNAVSLKLLNTIPNANLFTLDDSNLWAIIRDAVRYLFWVRKHRIDTVIDLELFSRVTAILSGLSGANNRVGFFRFHNEGLYRGNLMTHRISYNPHIHIAKNFIAMVNALAANNNERPYSKSLVSDDEIQIHQPTIDPERCRKLLLHIQEDHVDVAGKRLILINSNASDLLPQRRWPIPRFAELIQTILQQHKDCAVLLTGSPSEATRADALRQLVNDPRCINFCGKVKFLDLPVLYHIATLMVTNDSGPGHFAATTSLPTYVIFGPETPSLYGPLGTNGHAIFKGLACSPCVSAANHRKTPCHNNICLQRISAQEVYQQLIELTPSM